MSAVEFSMQQ